MFDLTQLVQGEILVLFLSLLFLSVGAKYKVFYLGLIVVIEMLITTFIQRIQPLQYYSELHANPDQAWIMCITISIFIQSLALTLILSIYKNPFIAIAYLINIGVNVILFIAASLVSLSPESNSAATTQTVMDLIYSYVFWASIALILAGLAKDRSGGRRNINNNQWASDNQLFVHAEFRRKAENYNQRFHKRVEKA